MKNLVIIVLLCVSGYACGQNPATVYINQYKDLAIQQSVEHHLPASLILGVAIHESASGTSKIARLQNNHFGIKGPNSNKQFKSSYKSYDSVALSYIDFVSMLQNRKQFSSLFKTCSPYDYKAWALGMKRGRYAASKLWAGQVIAIIKKYRLYEYDNRPDDYVEPISISYSTTKPTQSKKRSKVYTIKKGDTLSSIAKKHNTTVTNLRKQNRLKNDDLQIGQKLKTNSR